MGNKKILFVTATLEAGGTENVLANLSLQLKGKYDITILLNDTEKIAFEYGGDIISLGMQQEDDRTKISYQLKVFLRRYLKLRKLKKYGEYDACISLLDSANVANLLSGKRHCKVITTVYTNISASKYSKIYKYIVIPAIKCFYNKSDFIVVTSEGVRKDLEVNYNINPKIMKVIYDGVDINDIEKRKNESIDYNEYGVDNKKVITTLGRLDTAKGQWHLIRAMKKVVAVCPEAKLLIMGCGVLDEYLTELIEECNLINSVKLCGYVENPYKYIAESKAFVLSSIVEGYPTVLLESLVCGTPCISTDFDSGAREILAPSTDIDYKQKDGIEYAEYGIITPVCDGEFRKGNIPLTNEEEILANAIIAYLSDEQLLLDYKEKIKEYAKHFSIEECASQWSEILEEQFAKGK
jgi:glycosyltransferase involved in cell wall biosynthesis